MTQFLAPGSPVRTKSGKRPSESRETLSEHNYSRNIYIDDLIDNFAADEIDEENVPVDSMQVNVEQNYAPSREETNKDDDTNTASETEKEAAAGESEDVFESSQNSAEEELAKEKPREENIDTKEPGAAAPAADVSKAEEPEGEGGGEGGGRSYRSNLVVTCDSSCTALPRKNCASLLTVSPGLAGWLLLCLCNSKYFSDCRQVPTALCHQRCGDGEDGEGLLQGVRQTG